MSKFKGTKGEWFINFVGPIPIGVNAKLSSGEGWAYSRNIVETILPETDEDWEVEKKETTANLKLIAAAPDLLAFAMEMAKRYRNSPWIADQANRAIKKALGQ